MHQGICFLPEVALLFPGAKGYPRDAPSVCPGEPLFSGTPLFAGRMFPAKSSEKRASSLGKVEDLGSGFPPDVIPGGNPDRVIEEIV